MRRDLLIDGLPELAQLINRRQAKSDGLSYGA
jgi:hypothetical protein